MVPFPLKNWSKDHDKKNRVLYVPGIGAPYSDHVHVLTAHIPHNSGRFGFAETQKDRRSGLM